MINNMILKNGRLQDRRRREEERNGSVIIIIPTTQDDDDHDDDDDVDGRVIPINHQCEVRFIATIDDKEVEMH
jgi:hypothetical protein